MDPKIKPSQIEGNTYLTAIRKRKSWNEAEEVAKWVTDKRVILNEKVKQRQHTLPYAEGYEFMREYKLHTDEKDPLLIYSAKENEHIVFKISCSKMMVTN